MPNHLDGRQFYWRVVGHFDGNYHDKTLGAKKKEVIPFLGLAFIVNGAERRSKTARKSVDEAINSEV